MQKLNIQISKKLLQDFDFKTLFIEELGWSNPTNKKDVAFNTKFGVYNRRAIAEMSGAIAFEIYASDGLIPDVKIRAEISAEITKINFEHILIFIDRDRTQCIWRWLKKQDRKALPREHLFSKGQSGDLFISKLAGLFIDISEIENNITITDVGKKIKNALDIERVTKQFFREYETHFALFLQFIEGIDNEADKRWYASVILNRLMFIYFLQKKMFLDNGNGAYLSDKLAEVKADLGQENFYPVFLKNLFFEGFAKVEGQRNDTAKLLIGNIKYLNGGLFLQHKIEKKYEGKIKIADKAFENLFSLFNSYSWTLDDTPGGADNEINPDVLGYIFEKYINQKAFGAYYTRTEITEYLCEQTVYKLILDEINGPEMPNSVPEMYRNKRFESMPDLLLNLNAETCQKLVVGKEAILPNLSLLDPACGSGAFLVAAMKTLINVYAAIFGKIEFLGSKRLTEWKQKIEKDHTSIHYYIKREIITNNLYGVDIMEEATEIAKLRLFLALVASADTVDQLEPLPNIDFNIMSGNSLIGMMRVDANQFNKLMPKTVGNAAGRGKVVLEKTFFQAGVIQTDLFAKEHTKSYTDLIAEKEAHIRAYKNAHQLGITDLQALRDKIQEQEAKANEILNQLLLQEFNTLGIFYEQATWDSKNNKEGKPKKRPLTIDDINALEPFHWGYEFSEIFRNKDGFDAIITNPPWEVFKPNSKEFFLEYSDTISRKKMSILDFEKEQTELLKDANIKLIWTEYLSRYPHISSYFRSAKKFENQISVVSGKKAGTDINLYKLFTEQSYNLLKTGGYCGIVIPSGIYSDLGTKKLREMLFDLNKITGLFSFENKKEIFEGVHRSFKFVVLSFEKGGKTKSFPTAFMRHEVSELDIFPTYGALNISVDLIKKLSPGSLSIMELKNEIDFKIVEQLLKFPQLGMQIENSWNLKLGNEFHMTNDSSLFKSTKSDDSYPLYEGKMIWQFNSFYSKPKFWIDKNNGRESMLGRINDNNQNLSFQNYRLAFRDVTSPTNERTMINTILPKNVFSGNTLVITKNKIECSDLLSIVSFTNSYINDFFIRQKITSHCNLFYVYQLPVPRLQSSDPNYRPIVEKAARLICTTPEFAELWEEVMQSPWSEQQAATTEAERNQLRAELDGIIAHIYGLTAVEFEYILSTFPIVAQAQKDLVMSEFLKTA